MKDSITQPTKDGAQKSADREKFYFQASVKHWRKWEKRHLCNYWVVGILSLIIVIGAASLIANIFSKDGWKLLELLKKNDTPFFALSSIFVMIAIPLFVLMQIWRYVGPGLRREINLSIDAGFRASTLKTYLRLLRDGAITEEERIVILKAVFRPPILPTDQDGTLDINMVQRHLRPPSQ